jgi:hypothetical protein
MTMTMQGGCYCGAIRYEAQGAPFHCTLCHCSDCRRVSGAPAVGWFSVAAASLRFTRGSPKEFRSSEQVMRSFCGDCGTMLTWRHDGFPGEVDITSCSLDQPGLAAPQDHTFAHSRVPWLQLCDGLPAYPRLRAEGQAVPMPANPAGG